MSPPKSKETKPPNPRLGCLLLLALCVFTAWLIGQPLVQRGWPPLVAHFTAIVGVMLLVVVLALTTSAQGRSTLRFLARHFEFIDWRAARRASAAMRKIEPRPPFEIWSDCGDDIPFDPAQIADRVAGEFTDRTGLGKSVIQPTRLIVFDRWNEYQRYTRPLIQSLEMTGLYLNQKRSPRIILCIEAARAQYSLGEAGVFETLVAYQLLHQHYGKQPEPWLQTGIAVAIARARSKPSAPGAVARYHAAEIARESLIPAGELLETNRYPLSAPLQKLPPAEKSARFTRMAHQSALLVKGLLAECGPQFMAFLQSRRRLRFSPQKFIEEFGLSLEDVFESAERELLDRPLPEYIAPPLEARQLIDERLLQLMLDESVPLPLRRMAVNNLGLLGYPWRVRELIRIADDDFEELQQSALYAVENIAGRNFRSDRRGMADWLKELPGEVVASDQFAAPGRAARVR